MELFNNEFKFFQELAKHQCGEQTTLAEVKDLLKDDKYSVFPYKNGVPAEAKGPIVASFEDENGDLFIVARKKPSHVIIQAQTGGGKTQGFILNTTLNFNKECSYIVTDVKGEITPRSYAKACEVYGKDKVIVLNFSRPEYSMVRLNPLMEYVEAYIIASKIKNDIKRREAQEKAIGLLDDYLQELFPSQSQKDRSWEDTARSYIKALCVGLLEDVVLDDAELKKCGRPRVLPHQVTFKAVFDIFNTFISDNRSSKINDNGFFSSRPNNSLAKMLAKSVNDNAITTRQNYFGFVSEFLKKVTDGRINQISKANTFDLNQLTHEPMALFIIYDSTSEVLREWVNSLLSRTLNNFISSYGKTGKPLSTHVNMIIDEFPTLKPHDSYINALTTGRGSNISLSLVIQSISQLRARYPEEWETILQNCGVEICMGANNRETAKKFIESLGDGTFASEEAYITDGSCKFVQRNVLTYDKLMHNMSLGEAYIRRDNDQPLHSFFSLHFQTKEYSQIPLVENNFHTQIVPDSEFVAYSIEELINNQNHDLDYDDDDFDFDFDLPKFNKKPSHLNKNDEVDHDDDDDDENSNNDDKGDISLKANIDFMSYMFGVDYSKIDMIELDEFNPNYQGKFCSDKEFKVLEKIVTADRKNFPVESFENDCMNILDRIAKMCPTRYIAIILTAHYCDILAASKNVDRRLYALMCRAVIELRACTNEDYIDLKKEMK